MRADGRPRTRNDGSVSRPAHREARAAGHRDTVRSRSTWVFLGFLAITAFVLAVEHRAHLYGLLPWLILLACPLMHFFMHHGQGHGAHRHVPRDREGSEEE